MDDAFHFYPWTKCYTWKIGWPIVWISYEPVLGVVGRVWVGEEDSEVQSSSSRRSWMERGAEVSLSHIFYYWTLQMKIKRLLWKEGTMDSDYYTKCLSLWSTSCLTFHMFYYKFWLYPYFLFLPLSTLTSSFPSQQPTEELQFLNSLCLQSKNDL